MNFKPWLDRGDIQSVVVSEKSLADLLRLVERDLKDAKIESLSEDRRFATAYGAALNLCNYVIRSEGYRVTGKVGHHKIAIDLAGSIIGSPSNRFLSVFDISRRKRNKIDYDVADTISETEVIELISIVEQFKTLVTK